jgi:type I restriction enzyme S subunit
MNNGTWRELPIAAAADSVSREDLPILGRAYRQVGVRLWGQGAYEREPLDGGATKYRRLYRLEPGDIVVNKIWARNGSVAIVPPALGGCFVSSEFPTFVPRPEVLAPEWFHWLTKMHWFWAKCDEKSRGTSGKNRIRPERFLEITIPLPPLDEQRRIVGRIEDIAGKIEEARGLRRAAAEEAEAVMGATERRLFCNQNWPKRPLGDLIAPGRLKNGISVKSSEGLSGTRCLTLSAMRGGRVNAVESKPVPLSLPEAVPYLVSQGDVFVVRGNGSKHLVGRAGVMRDSPQNTVFPDLYIRIDLEGSGLTEEFFVAAWNSPQTREIIEERAKTTSGIWKVNQGHVLSIPVPVPSAHDQGRVVAELAEGAAKVNGLGSLQTETAVELEALLPSVLERAFRGEL